MRGNSYVVTHSLRNIWQAIPRGLRWAFIGLLALTVLAAGRLTATIFASNAPYRDEIATDMGAWHRACQERVALSAESEARLADAPPLLTLRSVEDIFRPIAQGADPSEAIGKVLDFYSHLGPERWSPVETLALEPIFAAADKREYIQDELRNAVPWFMAENRYRAVALRFELDGQILHREDAYSTALPAALRLAAEMDDTNAVIDMCLDALDVGTEIPRPVQVDIVREVLSNAFLQERALLAAAARADMSEEQEQRHNRIWDELTAPDLLNEAVRNSAVMLLDFNSVYSLPSGGLAGYGLYEMAKEYDSGANGFSGKTFDLFGLASGQSYLLDQVNYAQSLFENNRPVLHAYEIICALREYEKTHGKFPNTVDELFANSEGLDKSGTILCVPAANGWTLRADPNWQVYGFFVTVVPLTGGNVLPSRNPDVSGQTAG